MDGVLGRHNGGLPGPFELRIPASLNNHTERFHPYSIWNHTAIGLPDGCREQSRSKRSSSRISGFAGQGRGLSIGREEALRSRNSHNFALRQVHA